MTLYSGKCVGGPANGGMLHHGETVYQVGRDRHTKRLIIGYAGPDTEDIAVAKYHYSFSDGLWHWTPRRNDCARISGDGHDHDHSPAALGATCNDEPERSEKSDVGER